MEKTALIIYHRVDYDGIFSYCIVRKFLEQQPEYTSISGLGYTYGDNLPELSEIVKYNTIFILDLGFSPENMIALKNCGREIVWLDHHETHIENSKKYNYQDIPGERKIGIGACEICWKYLYKKEKLPTIIQCLSLYDVWNKNTLNWDSLVYPLQLGLKSRYSTNAQKIWRDWDLGKFLVGSFFTELVRDGQLISKYEKLRNMSQVRCYSFPVEVAGKYQGVAMLTTNFTSTIFESLSRKYKIFICLNMKQGDLNHFMMSMYCDPGSIDLNLGEYLIQKYGVSRAGGHACSCGTSLTLDEFIDIITTKKV